MSRVEKEKLLNGSIYTKEDIEKMSDEQLDNTIKQFMSFNKTLRETTALFEKYLSGRKYN